MTANRPTPIGAGLERLDGSPILTYFSAGEEAKAREIAARAARTNDWLSGVLGPVSAPPLYVVGPDEWNQVAIVPVYGLPHTFPDRTVVSTTPATFWHDYTEVLLPRLSERRAGDLLSVYGVPPELGSQLPDLLVAHELTHLHHSYNEATDTTDFPRLWLAELFANVGLYGYLSEVEPSKLPLVQAISHASHVAGSDLWPVTDLNQMGDSLAEGPLNYCWFEFMLIRLAEQIWEIGGSDALKRIHDSMCRPLDDVEIVDRFKDLHPAIAASVAKWPA